MKKEFRVRNLSNMKNEFKLVFFWILELLKEAERVRQTGSRNFKEKIDIYHETAEACRSVGKNSS